MAAPAAPTASRKEPKSYLRVPPPPPGGGGGGGSYNSNDAGPSIGREPLHQAFPQVAPRPRHAGAQLARPRQSASRGQEEEEEELEEEG